MIADMVQEADEPALEALYDVTVTFTEVYSRGFYVEPSSNVFVILEESDGFHTLLPLRS